MNNVQKWLKTGEQIVYDGYRKVLRRTFTLPDGQSADFDIFQAVSPVAILALTPDNQVVCFEQFRPGPEAILCELPGGVMEVGEEPLQAMERELREETGYRADIEYVGSYWRDAYTSARWHIFVGRNAERIAEPEHDATEFGEARLLSLDEFKSILSAGNITDTTAGYAGLHHLGLL
jgi:ADP-ribose pyrophosphatase